VTVHGEKRSEVFKMANAAIPEANDGFIKLSTYQRSRNLKVARESWSVEDDLWSRLCIYSHVFKFTVL
jgi:hypothetical protein